MRVEGEGLPEEPPASPSVGLGAGRFETSAQLGVAQSTYLERVRWQIEDSVLRGFHVRVDLSSVGASRP